MIRVLLAAALVVAGCGPAGNADDHLKKGTALVADGKFEAAIPELTRAAELNRDSIAAHTQLGNAYRGLKQYDKAFEAYRAAKKIDRLTIAPHLENARALVEAGQIDQAIDQLNHVVELDSKNLDAMLLLGRVSMMARPGGVVPARESVQRAELNLESALVLAPDNLDAHHGLAQVRERLGKRDEARAQWAKVQELAAGKPEHAALAAEATAALARLKR